MIEIYWTLIGLIGLAGIVLIGWTGGVISLATAVVMDR